MRRSISLVVLCTFLVLTILSADIAYINAAASPSTNQSRLKLPADFPAEIPFTDDAFNVNGERKADEGNIFLDYQTNKKYADVTSMYRAFAKANDSSCQEIKQELITIFTCKFAKYSLSLLVTDLGVTNVNMTLSFNEGLPEIEESTTAEGAKGMPEAAVKIETNQNRLKLPAFLPADIPFTKDAALVKVEDNSKASAGSQSINITYSSQKGKNAAISVYQAFTRTAEKNNEMQLNGTYMFSSTFKQYEMQTSISGSPSGMTQIVLKVTPTYPMNGVFNNHYTVTDYSSGKADNSGIINSSMLLNRRLMAGPRHTDPYYTNIFLRKENGTLWGYGSELYKNAVKDDYGRWKAEVINKAWTLVDNNAYCADTEGDNYCLLKPDGSLWTYGANSHYFLGNGEVNQNIDCPPTEILDNVKKADIGKNGIAVKRDGSLWLWGCSSALLSVLNNPEDDRLKPEKVMDNVFDAVQSGSVGWDYGGNIMVLKTDGSLWMWGEGNCGDGGVTTYRKTPIKIMNGVKAIEASNSLCCVIKNDNSLWVWESHVTGLEANKALIKPTKIMENVKMVSPGERFLTAIKNDGTVWTYGDNFHGQCGTGSLSPAYLQKPQKILEGALEVISTDHNAFALMKDGRVLGWGINDHTRKEGDYDWLKSKEWKVPKPTETGIKAK